MCKLRCKDLGPEWDCVVDFSAHGPTREDVNNKMLAHCGSSHPEQLVNLTVEKVTAKIENMISKTEEEDAGQT